MTPDFFEHITGYGSLSVVGMAKNVGKTVCLRALLDHCFRSGQADSLAVTSVGTDGESLDIVYKNEKPELTFYPGMLVQTAEQYYHRRRLTAEVLEVSRESTACGRLVTARVKTPGKLIISGQAHTQGLQEYIRTAHALGAKTALIDGALSRLSLASPFVSEAMVLCTGAAVSRNMDELVRKTAFQYRMLNLPRFAELPVGRVLSDGLQEMAAGVHGIGQDGAVTDLEIPSLLQIDRHMEKIEPFCVPGAFLYVSGLLNDAFLKRLSARRHKPDLVVSDFTKLFFSEQAYREFTRSGARLFVLRQPKVIGLCVNPLSPDGYRLDSAALRRKMQEVLGRPVYDILA
ncbi:MAG: hypothetical protein NC396_08080 [Bacteroides sp.]|nr:hypothetical protein [Bacteroides sp.]MCM1086291.1 hypothetical protein [Bacteroides sp.]